MLLIATLLNETLLSVWMAMVALLAALLNETDTAKALNVTKACLRRWRREARRLPFVKVGRLVRYRQQDVDAFIANNTQDVTGEATKESRQLERVS